MNVISERFQCVHVKFSFFNGKSWDFLAVYGSPNDQMKSLLWQELNRISETTTSPWLLEGNFNPIKSPVETTSVSKYSLQKCYQFVSWINELQLVDLSFTGYLFT